MKLLNHSLIYLSLAFIVILGSWSVFFYFDLKDEIRDSIDDGLDNNRLLILQKINTNKTLLQQHEFGGNNFEIHPITKKNALHTKDIFKDTLMYRQNENDLEPVRILHTAFEEEGQFYDLKIISSLVEEDDLIEDAFWNIIWLFFILIGSTILINNLVLKRVWKPFYSILNDLKAYRLDKNESLINQPTITKEFNELQLASNALIKHAKETYSAQKQFTENASHELQTPLAIIINKLELLLEEEKSEKSGNCLAEILKIAERLKQLNKSLLLLARIENKQFAAKEKLVLNNVAKDFLSDFESFISFKKVKINIEENSLLRVNMDPALGNILVANLIKNAIFHNKEKGYLKLIFTNNSLMICNTGKENALHSENIFNRFQKDSSQSQSTGLGLAVCKAICQFYGFHLNYQFIENEHCFILKTETEDRVRDNVIA